jgi:hypothetical protein
MLSAMVMVAAPLEEVAPLADPGPGNVAIHLPFVR